MHIGHWTFTRKTLEKQKEVGKGKKTTRGDWLVGWCTVQEWGLGTPNYHVMEDESEVVQEHIWTNRRNQLEDITKKWSGDLTFERRGKYKENSGPCIFFVASVIVRMWWLYTDKNENPRKGEKKPSGLMLNLSCSMWRLSWDFVSKLPLDRYKPGICGKLLHIIMTLL